MVYTNLLNCKCTGFGCYGKVYGFFSRKTESAKKQSKDYIYFMLHYRQFAVYFISDSAG